MFKSPYSKREAKKKEKVLNKNNNIISDMGYP